MHEKKCAYTQSSVCNQSCDQVFTHSIHARRLFSKWKHLSISLWYIKRNVINKKILKQPTNETKVILKNKKSKTQSFLKNTKPIKKSFLMDGYKPTNQPKTKQGVEKFVETIQFKNKTKNINGNILI